MKMRLLAAMLLGGLTVAGCTKGQPTDLLLADLKSEKEDDRVRAVRNLQHRKGDAQKVIPALIESLKDEHADIRRGAANGLGYLGAEAKSALPALEKAKDDKDARVRNSVLAAISRIGGQK